MCEQLIARSGQPFRLEQLWELVGRLERFGIAGFGWGAAWLAPAGGLRHHVDVRAFRDDPDRDRVGSVETTSVLVHLRRPSRLSTIGIADTQPFLDPAGRFAFGHNGDLGMFTSARNGYRTQGRIRGRADSEVAARWLEDAWDAAPPSLLLARLHRAFGGQANFALLAGDGTSWTYAGNTENPVFTFRLGEIGIASTGVYSLDRSLFRLVAPGARDRRLVARGGTVSLGPDGGALAVPPSSDSAQAGGP